MLSPVWQSPGTARVAISRSLPDHADTPVAAVSAASVPAWPATAPTAVTPSRMRKFRSISSATKRPRPQSEIQAILTRVAAVDPTKHLLFLTRRQIYRRVSKDALSRRSKRKLPAGLAILQLSRTSVYVSKATLSLGKRLAASVRITEMASQQPDDRSSARPSPAESTARSWRECTGIPRVCRAG